MPLTHFCLLTTPIVPSVSMDCLGLTLSTWVNYTSSRSLTACNDVFCHALSPLDMFQIPLQDNFFTVKICIEADKEDVEVVAAVQNMNLRYASFSGYFKNWFQTLSARNEIKWRVTYIPCIFSVTISLIPKLVIFLGPFLLAVDLIFHDWIRVSKDVTVIYSAMFAFCLLKRWKK